MGVKEMFPTLYGNGFTDEMYKGNKPLDIDKNHFSAPTYRWLTQYGQGYTDMNGEVVSVTFDLDQYNSIYITGTHFKIIHYTTDSSKCWIFDNAKSDTLDNQYKDKIVRMLNRKFGCEYWKIVQATAKRLFLNWYKNHCDNEYAYEIAEEELGM